MKYKICVLLCLCALSVHAQSRYDTTGFVIQTGLRRGILETTGDSTGTVIIDTVFPGGGGGSGTVTSVGFTAGQGLTISGTNPITTSGTGIFGIANGSLGDSLMATAYLKASNNLSDIISQSSARTNLGLGTSATHASSDYFLVANNLSEGTASTMRSNLGLGTSATHASGDYLLTANNLSDVTASTARTNLGLGTSATHAATDFALSGANTDITSVSLNQTGLVVKGGDANALTIKPNETMTAGRTLNLKVNDVSRTIDLSGNLTVSSSATISGTNTGDQTITLTGPITGTGTGSFATTITDGSVTYAKLSVTGAILNADLAGSIAYSKLSLTGAILNADLAGSIAYSKLSLTGAILNADLANSSITIAGNSTALGGIVTLDAITGVSSNGYLKRTGANTLTYDNSTFLITSNNLSDVSSANTSLNNLLPSQATFSGRFLQTNGTNTSWVAGNSGTITTFSAIVNNGLTQSVANPTTTPALTLGIANGSIGDSSLSSTFLKTAVTSIGISGTNGIRIISGSPVTSTGTIALGITNHSIGDSSLALTYLTGNQTITLGTDLSGSGTTTLNATIVSNAVTTSKIADAAVTYAKIQNVSANSVLLGSSATGSGSPPSEITLGTNLSMSGSTLNAAGSSPGAAIFGDGSDGALNYDGTTTILGVAPVSLVYTLNRDIYPSSATVHSGVTIKTAGFRIYCTGTLIDSGTISYNGKDASGNTAGAASGSGSPMGTGAAGGNGGSAGVGSNGTQATQSMGGNGGAGGISGQGQSAGTAGTANAVNNFSVGGSHAFRNFWCLNTGTMNGAASFVVVAGGGGGSGGGGAQSTSGGGGGGGGGVLLINAYAISNPGVISANGGAGGNASGTNAGSGGGGGGGGVLIISHTYSGNAAVANGGSPGPTKTGTGVVGSSGSGGTIVSVTY